MHPTTRKLRKNVYSFRLILVPFFQNVRTLRHNKRLPEKTTAALITVLSVIFLYLCSLCALEGNIKLRLERGFCVLRRSCSFLIERGQGHVSEGLGFEIWRAFRMLASEYSEDWIVRWK
jgi:hypothetical protein